jgi:tetratricopeptide (TPR) repeat protein
VEALTNLGDALNTVGRYDEAIAYFDRVLALDPDAANTLRSRGHALRALHRQVEAISSYDKAILASPRDAALYYDRGAARFELNRHALAIEDFDRALAINPDYVDAHYARGHSLLPWRALTGGLSYAKTVSLDPNSLRGRLRSSAPKRTMYGRAMVRQ